MSAVFLKSEEEEKLVVVEKRNGFWRHEEEEEESSESSSIGVAGESSLSSSATTGREEGDDEAESEPKKDSLSSLSSLDSLEDSLPIKRGLSNFYGGKSKSFACITDMANGSAGDLAKHENPFNKRRRILVSCKNSWRRRASYSSLYSSLPPLLSPDHTVDEEEDNDERGDGDLVSFPLPPLTQDDHHEGKINKTPRSFSLSDLQHV